MMELAKNYHKLTLFGIQFKNNSDKNSILKKYSSVCKTQKNYFTSSTTIGMWSGDATSAMEPQ